MPPRAPKFDHRRHVSPYAEVIHQTPFILNSIISIQNPVILTSIIDPNLNILNPIVDFHQTSQSI